MPTWDGLFKEGHYLSSEHQTFCEKQNGRRTIRHTSRAVPKCVVVHRKNKIECKIRQWTPPEKKKEPPGYVAFEALVTA